MSSQHLDLNEVDVTLKNLGSLVRCCLGSWIFYWLAVLLRCSWPPSVAPCHFEKSTPLRKEKNKTDANSVNTIGTDARVRMLFCVQHHPMDAETQHPTWRIE